MSHRHVVMGAIGVSSVLGVFVAVVVNVATGGTTPSFVTGAIVVVLTLLLAGTSIWLVRLQTPDELRTVLQAHVDEYGSGKTWLLRWLAHEMATHALRRRRTGPIPVLIELGSLLDKDISTRGKLLAESVPRPVTESDLDGGRGAVVLLLDGLDELLGNTRSVERVRAILRGIVRAEPSSTRFLVACRAHVLESTNLVQLLGEVIADPDRQDSTRSVVQRAFGQVFKPDVMHIEPVSEDKAGTYLLASKAGTQWKSVRDQEAYRELALVPFTIFLLEEALPLLNDQTGRLDLPTLYRKAVEAWLSRGELTANDQSVACSRLEELTRAEFALREGEQRRSVEVDQMLLDSGILTHLDGRAKFRHYSLFEYFLACALHRDMFRVASTRRSWQKQDGGARGTVSGPR